MPTHYTMQIMLIPAIIITAAVVAIVTAIIVRERDRVCGRVVPEVG